MIIPPLRRAEPPARTEIGHLFRECILPCLDSLRIGKDKNEKFLIGQDEALMATVDAVWKVVNKPNATTIFHIANS